MTVGTRELRDRIAEMTRGGPALIEHSRRAARPGGQRGVDGGTSGQGGQRCG
jgi:hypothetical protein